MRGKWFSVGSAEDVEEMFAKDTLWERKLVERRWDECDEWMGRTDEDEDAGGERELVQVANNLRRAPGDITIDWWLRCVAAWDRRCAYCGDERARLAMEHIVPVCKGGRTDRNNIVPACRSCNSRKQTRDAESWLGADDFKVFVARLAKARSRMGS